MGCCGKNRRFNEFDGVLLGVFSFMSFSLYRAAHQSHHAYFATERDERSCGRSFSPTTPRWVRVLAAVLELDDGAVFTPFLFLRSFLRKWIADPQQEGAAAHLVGADADGGGVERRPRGSLVWPACGATFCGCTWLRLPRG